MLLSKHERQVLICALEHWAWNMDLDGSEQDMIDYSEGVDTRHLLALVNSLDIVEIRGVTLLKDNAAEEKQAEHAVSAYRKMMS